jgi:hypothetical protein
MIQSVPPGARVLLDGARVGETPLRLTTPLGRHEIQVARSGYLPRTEHVDLTERAASQTVRVQLRRGTAAATPASGAIDFDSRPRGAKVTVDGRAMGETPVRVADLSAGLAPRADRSGGAQAGDVHRDGGWRRDHAAEGDARTARGD